MVFRTIVKLKSIYLYPKTYQSTFDYPIGYLISIATLSLIQRNWYVSIPELSLLLSNSIWVWGMIKLSESKQSFAMEEVLWLDSWNLIQFFSSPFYRGDDGDERKSKTLD